MKAYLLILFAALLSAASATQLCAQNTSAPLLTTFTNPTPANAEQFGQSVAAMGGDRVLIGAPNAGERICSASRARC